MANRFLIVCGGSGKRLLGQRKVLGVDAELHIDVGGELINRADERSLTIALDDPLGTTQVLLLDLQRRMRGAASATAQDGSEYVQTEITDQADINHACFLIEHSTSGGYLRDGLAQSPAIGGAAIRNQANKRNLEALLRTMNNNFASQISPANPLEVWIVSSTAGGTGEGTHRFVGALLADTLGRQYSASLKLNFIRVGPLTYRSVNQQRTMLNTFFGVAADAAFELKFKEDFPGANVNWYYLDVPDTGITNYGSTRRSEVIELACKAIMLEELSEDMGKLLVNNSGMRMVVVRTGYWGRDFGDNLKYYETLRELQVKLTALVSPSYKADYVQKATRSPDFKSSAALEEAQEGLKDAGALNTKMQRESWQFPKTSVPRLLDDARLRDDIGRWTDAVNELLSTGRKVGKFDVRFTTIESVNMEGVQRQEEMPLRVPVVPGEGEFNAAWVRALTDAHRVKAWCDELLEGDNGLKQQLYLMAKKLSDDQHSWSIGTASMQRARKIAATLDDFLVLLEKVTHLMSLEDNVDKLLATHLVRPKDLLRLVSDQLEIAKRTIAGAGSSPIKAADLADPLNRLTGESWLCLLNRAAQQGRMDVFKQEVLRGATGLSEQGLVSVLELEEGADATRIRSALEAKVGSMKDREGKETQGPWWQAVQPPSSTLEYKYRILPKMDQALQAKLDSSDGGGQGKIRYIFTGLGVIGLYVLAFEGQSLNRMPGPDTLSAPQYLLGPLVPVVRDVLKAWRSNPQRFEPSGQFEIVSAGVIGEPLYRRALVGDDGVHNRLLSDDEIKKIEEYYTLYG